MTVGLKLAPNLTEGAYIALRLKAWREMEDWGWKRMEPRFWGKDREVVDTYTQEERQQAAEELFQWLIAGLRESAATPMHPGDLGIEEARDGG